MAEEIDPSRRKAFEYFLDTFHNIKRTVDIPDPWKGITDLSNELSNFVGPGEVVKAVCRYWRGQDSQDGRIIVIGTPIGTITLFDRFKGSSNGHPDPIDRGSIQLHCKVGLWMTLKPEHSEYQTAEFLATVINKDNPEGDNIGHRLPVA